MLEIVNKPIVFIDNIFTFPRLTIPLAAGKQHEHKCPVAREFWDCRNPECELDGTIAICPEHWAREFSE